MHEGPDAGAAAALMVIRNLHTPEGRVADRAAAASSPDRPADPEGDVFAAERRR